MPEKEADRELAKLKYVQALEGMRHVQRVEATEIGFVMVTYAVVIAGLLNMRERALGHSGAWLVVIFSVLFAGTLIFHFYRRRASYYRHVRRFEEASATLGEACNIKDSWAGFLIRAGIMVILTVAMVLLANLFGL